MTELIRDAARTLNIVAETRQNIVHDAGILYYYKLFLESLTILI
jgi:hypothetical protein